MKVVFVGYRDWALEILELLKSHQSANWQIVGPWPFEKVKYSKADIILLYGWSQIVDKAFLDIAPCISLHPSPLPKYRGGSPIQHQILAGEKKSVVTLYLVTEGIDEGPVIASKSFPLDGELNDILQRISLIGAELTIKMLDSLAEKRFAPFPQDESKATVYKRRHPSESEITLEEISLSSAKYIYNKIRALQDPYPNAFITCGDGEKIYLTKGHL